MRAPFSPSIRFKIAASRYKLAAPNISCQTSRKINTINKHLQAVDFDAVMAGGECPFARREGGWVYGVPILGPRSVAPAGPR
jgi:hypothetical protein